MVGSKGYNYLHESQTLEGGYEKILWKMYKIHRTDLPVYAIHKDASSKHGPQLSSLTKLRMAWPSPYTIRSLFDDRDGAAGRRGLHRGASRKKGLLGWCLCGPMPCSSLVRVGHLGWASVHGSILLLFDHAALRSNSFFMDCGIGLG